MAEHSAVNRGVVGSSPTEAALILSLCQKEVYRQRKAEKKILSEQRRIRQEAKRKEAAKKKWVCKSLCFPLT